MKLTRERVINLLDYDENKGVFTWKKTTSSRVKVGGVAGYANGNGYQRMSIDGKKLYAHHVAWLFVKGVWPIGEIDHINGDRSDNRIVNLREASRSQNAANIKSRSSNKHGLIGVCWDETRGKWLAQITKDYKNKFIGYFYDVNEAASARDAWAAKLHGEFAVMNIEV